jgi:hypothetical protein
MLENINERILLYLCVPGGSTDPVNDEPLTPEGIDAAHEIA